MRQSQCVAFAALAVLTLSTAATAGPPPGERIRGTIEAVNGDTLAFKTYSGQTVDLGLNPDTKYVWVLPAHLTDVKSSNFVGITATGPESKMVALEVHIFPESMRGTGEGHYPWSLPAMVADADQGNTSASAGGPPVAGTMTNGTVSAATSAATSTTASGGPPVAGTMTNGTVAAGVSQGGGKELTVTYSKGQTAHILVPANAPVVLFAPADKSALTQGAKAFVIAGKQANGGGLDAAFVLVGKNGLMPPM